MTASFAHPKIIQGGMGVGVSNWRLARTVASAGHLGVVSGTSLDLMLARRLQLGDPTGEVVQAMTLFPWPEMAIRVLKRYFIMGGKMADTPFAPIPMHSLRPPAALVELTVLANFVEMTLAKMGHGGKVGINFLEKIQLPTLPSIYGALLAGVDYILMGAGIPRSIPGVLDALATGRSARLKIDVEGALAGEEFFTEFDPVAFSKGEAPQLQRPWFLPIVSSATLAITLARKSNGKVDGFIVEGPLAGGHNAPPRGAPPLSEVGEPIYGERDVPDLEKIKALGLPFWLAGDYARPEKLREALSQGAAGVQIGTAFAYCAESGIDPEFKSRVLQAVREERAKVFTDPVASPTGFPFKVVRNITGAIGEESSLQRRNRSCDLGYLRHAWRRTDGTVGYRCPAEPVANFVTKGGREEETAGRICLCNGLMATVGLGQVTSEQGRERPILTAGDDLLGLKRFFKNGALGYSAADVLETVLAQEDGAPASVCGADVPSAL